MKRRDFLAASCISTGFASLAGTDVFAAEAPRRGPRDRGTPRDFYELRRYELVSEAQQKRFNEFLSSAAIAAFNRAGIGKVGVFYEMEKTGPAYVLLQHKSRRTILSLRRRLLADETFEQKAKKFLDTPAETPLYKRMESSLMASFEGHPELAVPTTKESRIFQLRIYESHSMKASQKKIEMFNKWEIEIFKKTGLHPVFFGETIFGDRMPNLTYMLGFDDMEESKKNWRTFVTSADWKRVSSIPEYADKKIICNITNIYLKPAACSQI